MHFSIATEKNSATGVNPVSRLKYGGQKHNMHLINHDFHKNADMLYKCNIYHHLPSNCYQDCSDMLASLADTT